MLFNNTDQYYIQDLIAQGEGLKLDFKYHVADSAKIAKTLVAFANSSGGKILLGVKDNGKIIGIESDEEIYMIEGAANLYCSPKIDFSVEEWEIDGKIVLEINISESPDKPHYVKDENGKWRVYIRVDDNNKYANRVIVEVLKRKGRKKRTMIYYSKEEKLLLEYLSDHDSITLEKFMHLAHIGKRKAENILINLASVDVLAINNDGKNFIYSLNNEMQELKKLDGIS